MDDNKQIKKDWSLREERTARKKDVVIDLEGNLGIVIRTEGEFGRRFLWVEDVEGGLVYDREESKNFRVANRDQTVSFYGKYKVNKGWTRNSLFTISGKDYPIQLIQMEYDLKKFEMLYVFRDLNVPDFKHFKTLDESLVKKVPDWYQDAMRGAFLLDSSSQNSHEIKITLEEKPISENAWTVSGSAISFSSRDLAEMEIESWESRLKIRRVASVLSRSEKVKPSIVTSTEDGFLYVTDFKERSGQPAVFNSRVDAAVALITLGERTWMSALNTYLDEYDI